MLKILSSVSPLDELRGVKYAPCGTARPRLRPTRVTLTPPAKMPTFGKDDVSNIEAHMRHDSKTHFDAI